MTDKIARVCDYCGKFDVLEGPADSNGMIMVQGGNVSLLLMADIKEGKPCRSSFNLTGKTYHSECLPKAITKWIEEVK